MPLQEDRRRMLLDELRQLTRRAPPGLSNYGFMETRLFKEAAQNGTRLLRNSRATIASLDEAVIKLRNFK